MRFKIKLFLYLPCFFGSFSQMYLSAILLRTCDKRPNRIPDEQQVSQQMTNCGRHGEEALNSIRKLGKVWPCGIDQHHEPVKYVFGKGLVVVKYISGKKLVVVKHVSGKKLIAVKYVFGKWQITRHGQGCLRQRICPSVFHLNQCLINKPNRP